MNKLDLAIELAAAGKATVLPEENAWQLLNEIIEKRPGVLRAVTNMAECLPGVSFDPDNEEHAGLSLQYKVDKVHYDHLSTMFFICNPVTSVRRFPVRDGAGQRVEVRTEEGDRVVGANSANVLTRCMERYAAEQEHMIRRGS